MHFNKYYTGFPEDLSTLKVSFIIIIIIDISHEFVVCLKCSSLDFQID